MKHRTIIFLICLFGFALVVNAQQTMTFEERIRAEVEFPKLTVFGGRVSPDFPISSLDLKPGDVLSKVPHILYSPDPVERKPLLNFQVNERDRYKTSGIKIEFELKK